MVAVREGRSGYGKTAAATIKRKLDLDTVEALNDHEVWKSGLQLSCYSSGLKPELVSSATKSVIDMEATRAFEFDPELGAKATGRVSAFKVCKQRHGGICSQEPFTQRGDLGSRNLHNLLHEHDLKAISNPTALFYDYHLLVCFVDSWSSQFIAELAVRHTSCLGLRRPGFQCRLHFSL